MIKLPHYNLPTTQVMITSPQDIEDFIILELSRLNLWIP